jgi:hypothetical protein
MGEVVSQENDDFEMTVEDFAKWLLTLDDEVKKKKIWFIDINKPYKSKGLWIDKSPSGQYISIEDSHDE